MDLTKDQIRALEEEIAQRPKRKKMGKIKFLALIFGTFGTIYCIAILILFILN